MRSPWIVPPKVPEVDGTDRFIGADATVADFWKFALSDLRMNNARGYLAEFLVAKALGLQSVRRVEWDAYDLLLDGIRVEVKSSAYLHRQWCPAQRDNQGASPNENQNLRTLALMDLSAPSAGLRASGLDELLEAAQVRPDLHVVEPERGPGLVGEGFRCPFKTDPDTRCSGL